MSSVPPSVCLSVTLVNQDHIGWNSWKVIARTIKYTFACSRPKAIHLFPGERGEIWGRLEVGWEEVACWNTKAAISLKRVKIEEKLLWRAYRKSPTLFRTVTSPISYTAFASPRLGFATPKTSIGIISGVDKATDLKFGCYISRVHPNKSPLNIFIEK